MANTIELFIEKRPQSKDVIAEYSDFLATKNEEILDANEEDIAEFREILLEKYSRANATERLLIVRDLYTFIKQKASKTQYLRYLGIILLQAFVIISSSIWLVPKYKWTSFLWLDRLSVALFGMTKEFFVPGYIGGIVAFVIVFVLIARKWFEKPRNFLGWIVMVLNVWIFAILYGLIIGDEKVLFSGGLNSYITIVAITAIILGFKKIVGYAVLALVIFAGFNITAISAKLNYMAFPYIISFFFCIFAQNPDMFDKLLGWINGKFLSGQAQEIGKQTAQSVQDAAKTIGDKVKRATGNPTGTVDERLNSIKSRKQVSPKKTNLLN